MKIFWRFFAVARDLCLADVGVVKVSKNRVLESIRNNFHLDEVYGYTSVETYFWFGTSNKKCFESGTQCGTASVTWLFSDRFDWWPCESWCHKVFPKFTDKVVGVFHAAPYTERRMKSTPLLIYSPDNVKWCMENGIGLDLFGTVHQISSEFEWFWAFSHA